MNPQKMEYPPSPGSFPAQGRGHARTPCAALRTVLFQIALTACLFWSVPIQAGFTNSWRVFRSLSNGNINSNKVVNPGMETLGSSTPLSTWGAFGSGYTASSSTVHAGTRSMQCTAVAASDVHGGYQTITLNQSTPKALKLSGWSKAQGVSGATDSEKYLGTASLLT